MAEVKVAVTPEWVTAQRLNIAKHSGDAERAHAYEDDLYERIIQSIADGQCEEPQVCCKIAIKTKDLNFSRWCA